MLTAHADAALVAPVVWAGLVFAAATSVAAIIAAVHEAERRKDDIAHARTLAERAQDNVKNLAEKIVGQADERRLSDAQASVLESQTQEVRMIGAEVAYAMSRAAVAPRLAARLVVLSVVIFALVGALTIANSVTGSSQAASDPTPAQPTPSPDATG